MVRRLGSILLAAALLAACGDPDNRAGDPGPGGGSGGNDGMSGGTGGASGDPCATPIDSYIENLVNVVPSWDTVNCFTSDLQRMPEPAYFKRALAGTLPPEGNIVMQHLHAWDDYYVGYDVNVSSLLTTIFPPYFNPDGSELTYPLPPDIYDAHLRGWALVAAREKKLGKRVMFINFYPPSSERSFASRDDFDRWVDDVFIPEKVAEAKVAELVKAEYYIPFILEMEVFVNGLDAIVANMTDTEKVAFAQAFMDKIHDAVAPYFHGIIAGHSYANYDAQPYWKNLDFSKFDQVHFAMFPGCDLATVRDTYVPSRLAAIDEIATRDHVDWIVDELTVYEKYFTPCGTDLATIEPQVFQAVFDNLDQAKTPPKGLGFAAYLVDNPETKSTINTYLQTK